MATSPAPRRIVVGVDASAESQNALRWALDQAEWTKSAVRVVTAWNVPSNYDLDIGLPESTDVAAAAERVQARIIDEVTGGNPRVPIEQIVTHGHAVDVLLHEAENADLLVVGSHGRRGFARALLGSVSNHCVQHASCPVVVVREPKD